MFWNFALGSEALELQSVEHVESSPLSLLTSYTPSFQILDSVGPPKSTTMWKPIHEI